MGSRISALMLLVGILVCAKGAGPMSRVVVARGASSAQNGVSLHRSLDEILDVYVRDGLVYYRALQIDRAKLDRYIEGLGVPAATYDTWSRDDQVAYWLNAYNAFVLETVVTHYPIRGASPEYPAESIRQVAGAFDRRSHQAAGRSVTLDQIETNILRDFGDPRVFVALGRGALGSGRLRSEAYQGSRLEAQLAQAAEEFATQPRYVNINPLQDRIDVSPIFGWREADFVVQYGTGDDESLFTTRSAIERAILAFVQPYVLPLEDVMLRRNTFKVSYQSFDWRLNDLTGGRPD